MPLRKIEKSLVWPFKLLHQGLSRRHRYVAMRPPYANKQALLDKRTRKTIRLTTRNNVDRSVIKHIFIREDYNTDEFHRHADIRRRYEALLAEGKKPLIIDAGANIGASCVYLANEFPQAQVVGIEPEPQNAKVAAANCAAFPNIKILHAGVANKGGRARIHNPAAENWGFQTLLDDDGDLVLVSINELVAAAKAEGQVPFLIKIDIEGFEDNVFSSDTEWLDEFYLLAIELHDWMLPGQANSRQFLECVAPLGRDFVYRGENVFSIKN